MKNKKFNAIFGVLISLVLLSFIPNISAFAGGTGSAGDPYQVATWAQLDSVRGIAIPSYYILTVNLSSASPGYAGIGDSWTPIGNSYLDPFVGNFNGSGNTISNLIVNAGIDAGLFKFSGADIENLGLLNVNVTGTGIT